MEYKKVLCANDNVLEKLNHMKDYSITIIDAPAGYGKTTALKYYAQKSDANFLWINITTASKDIFWLDFCERIGRIHEETGNKLYGSEYPNDEKNIAKIRNILTKIRTDNHVFLVMDNYNLVADEHMEMLIGSLVDEMPERVHFVLVTQGQLSDTANEFISKGMVLYVSKKDLEFSGKDIKSFFKKYNLTISDQDANKLYEYSEGWISAIYLQLLSYVQQGNFDIGSSLETLFWRNVWSRLTKENKDLLIMCSRLGHFTMQEARILAPYEDEDNLEKFLKDIVFIRFDKSNRKYYVHNIFKDYIESKYNLLNEDKKCEVAIKCGKVYEYRNEMVKAYKEYYNMGQWENIFSSTPGFDCLYPDINSENKEFFMNIIKNCPDDIKDKYYYFRMIMCVVLFLYNEKEKREILLEDVESSIEADKNITDKQRKGLMATLYFVKGYGSLNDIARMKLNYEKSSEYGPMPVSDGTCKTPFTMSCPSIMHIFHGKRGRLNSEISLIDEMMPVYYKIMEGHGKGSEALFKAEALFNTGDVHGAETLCHKALYMADTRNQTCITIGAMLLLTRISIFEGDYEGFVERKEAVKNKISYENPAMDLQYCNMIEMSEAYIYQIIGEHTKTSKWLTDSSMIENKTNLINMSYANIIYGKYLYLSGQYKKFLGISGQFLGVASLFSSVMAEIYVYILITMSNLAINNREKSVKMLEEAIRLAAEDGLVIPFLENYEYLEPIFDEANFASEYRMFVKKIKQMSKNYIQSLKIIKKNSRNKNNYGLTARESDIAKLAAARLSNKEIAEQLFIAESTVKSNLKTIFSKLNITSRTELSSYFKQ